MPLPDMTFPSDLDFDFTDDGDEYIDNEEGAGEVYLDVHKERIRAHAKWDRPDRPEEGASMERRPWDDPAFLPVLVEEVGEVARVMCEERHGHIDHTEAAIQLREELVQVAAMTTAWIAAIDRAE